MNIFDWIKLQIKWQLEFEEACSYLKTLFPNKRAKEIKKIAKKLSETTTESLPSVIYHLCNYTLHPELLDKKIERLNKLLNENTKK